MNLEKPAFGSTITYTDKQKASRKQNNVTNSLPCESAIHPIATKVEIADINWTVLSEIAARIKVRGSIALFQAKGAETFDRSLLLCKYRSQYFNVFGFSPSLCNIKFDVRSARQAKSHFYGYLQRLASLTPIISIFKMFSCQNFCNDEGYFKLRHWFLRAMARLKYSSRTAVTSESVRAPTNNTHV